MVANINNGRFDCRLDFNAIHKELDEGLAPVPDALRIWAAEVGHTYIEHARLGEDSLLQSNAPPVARPPPRLGDHRVTPR